MQTIRKIFPAFLVILYLNGFAASVAAVSRLSVDSERDPRFLPYTFETIYDIDYGVTRRPVRNTCQLISTGTTGGTDTAMFVNAFNPLLNEDALAQVNFQILPGPKFVADVGVRLTLTDLCVWRGGGQGRPAAMLAGYRKDSAFVVRIYTDGESRDPLYLCSGEDATGDGSWRPAAYFLDTTDYDYDGRTELFVFVSTERDKGPRRLFCIDPVDMTVRWSTPVAAPINSRSFFRCADRQNPGLIFVTQCPSNGFADSVFDDAYSYLSRIDSRGRVVFAEKIGENYQNGGLFAPPGDSVFYMLHQLSVDTMTSRLPVSADLVYVSKVDCSGRVLRSMKSAQPLSSIWLADYNGDGLMELYTLCSSGGVRIYDSELNLLAEGQNVHSMALLDPLPAWYNREPVLALAFARITEIRTPGLQRLARMDSYYDIVRPLQYDSSGRLKDVIFSGPNHFLVASVVQRGFRDFVGIVYLDYQYHILAVSFSLLAGFIVMNYYRGRTRKNLLVISRQKSELEETHRKLQEAQRTIIAQEKFRQAKDIAGGFAHEIRNALFPAEAALEKLRESSTGGAGDPERERKRTRAAAEAVSRAIGITRLISQYTKLDSEYLPEAVDVAKTVDDVIKANGQRIEEAGVEVRVTGSREARVKANGKQLFMVINNLVVNSLDALTKGANPHIFMSWKFDSSGLTLTCEDNGCGIADENRSKVFDAFFSTKPSTGTGLGLAIVKKIVELYGGTVTVASKPGKGARFDLTLKLPDESYDNT
jgi:signal transduction histidine kinase